MKIITRYFIMEFIKYFISCLIIFLFLYLVIDFIQKMDNFSEADVSLGLTLAYFLYKIPYIIIQMIPVAALISVIVIFSLMKKNHEIVAMKACGLDIRKSSGPIILLSLLIVFITFLTSETLVPYTSSRCNEIWDVKVEKQDPGRFHGSSEIWYKSADSIYWIRHFDSKKKIMKKPSFYFFNDSFELQKKIHGKNGKWEDGFWVIEDGIIQELKNNGRYDIKRFHKLSLKIPQSPDIFIRGIKNPEDMGLLQLKNFAEKIHLEGYDNTRYLVDMNIKVSFPFISLVLVIIGIPIALRINKGGAALAVSIGVALCLFYMITFGFSRSIGLSGILPPVISAWSANLIFLLFGIYLIINMER